MKIELKKETDKTEINVGDAIVFNGGTVRILVETSKGYGSYGPMEGRVYFDTYKTITELMNAYEKRDIERIIKKDKLKIVEV